MTPRRASLRLAHSAACKNAGKTSLASLKGCTCPKGPSYYVFHRNSLGKAVKGERVRDRQVADRELRKVQVGIDEGKLGHAKPVDKTFRAWADEYLGIIEAHGRKAATVRAYRPTLSYANAAFGELALREVGKSELRQLVAKIRANDGSDATVSKHLRHLGAIFQQAADDSLIATNPVPKFKKSLRLKVTGGVAAFTDDELARLWTAMEREKAEPVYVAICKAAVTTGARQGELIGANLDDLDLLNGRLEIRHHYDRESGALTSPKDGEARTLYLIPPARAVLEDWIAKRPGFHHGGTDPIFPAPRSGGRLNGQYLTRVVANAMEKATAPIPSVGEGGRPRKPFHALRASYDRLMLERGRHPQWVQGQLGHSSADLTLNAYGAWSAEAQAAEADKVETAGFPV
jgi:integrase